MHTHTHITPMKIILKKDSKWCVTISQWTGIIHHYTGKWFIICLLFHHSNKIWQWGVVICFLFRQMGFVVYTHNISYPIIISLSNNCWLVHVPIIIGLASLQFPCHTKLTPTSTLLLLMYHARSPLDLSFDKLRSNETLLVLLFWIIPWKCQELRF